MQNLFHIFKEIGLDEKETSTYLMLLQIGQNPASIIAKKTAQHRSGAYAVLEKLMNKGLVQKIIHENTTYFQAVEPNLLLARLQEKQEDLEAKIEQFHGMIHQFGKIKKIQEIGPKVIFYQGKNSIQNIMEDTLTANETIRVYACMDELTELMPEYFAGYYKRRTAKGLAVKAIFPATMQAFIRKKRDKLELRESRLIPEKFNFHLDLLIYDHKVAMTSLKEKFGILIESREMAESQKRIFDTIWETTKQYDTEITATFEKQAQTKKTL